MHTQVTGDVAEDVRLKMENGWYLGLNTPMGPYKNHIRKKKLPEELVIKAIFVAFTVSPFQGENKPRSIR